MNTVPFPTVQEAIEVAAPTSFWRGLLPALDFSFSLVPRSIRERVARRRQRKQFAELWVEETQADEEIEWGSHWKEIDDSYDWPGQFKVGGTGHGFILEGLDVQRFAEPGDVDEALARLEGRIEKRVVRRNDKLVEKRMAKSVALRHKLAQLKRANDPPAEESSADRAAAFYERFRRAAEINRAYIEQQQSMQQSIECEEVAQLSFDSGVGLSVHSSAAQPPKSSALRGWRKLSDSNPLKKFLREDEQRLRDRGIDPDVMPEF